MIKSIKNLLSYVVRKIRNFCPSVSKIKPNKRFYYDFTLPLTPKTLVFPGDPVFKAEMLRSVDKGSSYSLCHLHFGNHAGTHIDFPAHVIKGGKTSSNYSVEDLVGEGIVIEVPENKDGSLGITKDFISKQMIQPKDIVFFKTQNSLLSETTISEKSVYLTKEGAEELIAKKIKIVGIDYLSIDNLIEEKLPVHNKLLKNDILIVENLNLKDVPSRRFPCIFIIPQRIPAMDGLPVRVFAC